MTETFKEALDNGKDNTSLSGPFPKDLDTLNHALSLLKLTTYNFWDIAIEFQKQSLADVL